MALYLGKPNTKGVQPFSAALTAIGVNLLRAAPCDVPVGATYTALQIAHSTYTKHLPAYISAMVTGVRQSTTLGGYAISIPVDDCFPLTLPPLVISYTAAMTPELTATLSEIGYTTIASKGKSVLLFAEVTIAQFRVIVATKPVTTTPTVLNSVNIEAMLMLIVGWRILSGFFKTHLYPAFTDTTDVFEGEIHDMFERSTKRKRGSDDVTDETMGGATAIAEAPVRTVNLYYAKPPATQDVLPWGDTSDIPNSFGLLCPYLEELTNYDRTTVPEIMKHYFFLCFGNSPSSAAVSYERFRRNWGTVSTTEAGNVFAHMAKIVGLAMTSQSRVFPMFSMGRYVGSVLSGAQFMVSLDGKEYMPENFADLTARLSTLRVHASVLKAISTIVSADVTIRKSVTDTMSMRQLSNILLGASLSEDQRDDIRREVVHLNYKVAFWPINSSTVTNFLRLVQNPLSVDDMVPMHNSMVLDNDPVARLLAAFGHTAPSFIIPNAPIVHITRTTAVPASLHTITVALPSAIADFKSMVLNKEIRNNPKDMGRDSKFRRYKGAEGDGVWEALKNVVVPLGVNNKAPVAESVDLIAAVEASLFGNDF